MTCPTGKVCYASRGGEVSALPFPLTRLWWRIEDAWLSARIAWRKYWWEPLP